MAVIHLKAICQLPSDTKVEAQKIFYIFIYFGIFSEGEVATAIFQGFWLNMYFLLKHKPCQPHVTAFHIWLHACVVGISVELFKSSIWNSLSSSTHLKAQQNGSSPSHNDRPPPLPEETYNQSLQVEAGRALIKYSSNTATAVRCSAVYHGVTQNEKWPKQTVLTSVPDSSCGS